MSYDKRLYTTLNGEKYEHSIIRKLISKRRNLPEERIRIHRVSWIGIGSNLIKVAYKANNIVGERIDTDEYIRVEDFTSFKVQIERENKLNSIMNG